MKRVRLGVLIAVAGTLLASGCSSAAPTTNGNPNPAPATTAPVGADGKPVTNLCDLLTADDINKIEADLKATAATPAAGSSMEAADCIYGKNLEFHIMVAPSTSDASSAYKQLNTDHMLAAMQDKPLGGVDDCVYGLFKSGGVGLNLRRVRMVASIVVPKTPAEAKVPLIQMAAIVLTRANALGT